MLTSILLFAKFIWSTSENKDNNSRIAFAKAAWVDNANVVHNDIYFKRINNDDELNKFLTDLETPSSSSSVSDLLYGTQYGSTYEVFSYDQIDVGYYLKNDGTTCCFELTEKNLLKNDKLKDNKAIEKKKLFSECLDQNKLPKKQNIEPSVSEGSSQYNLDEGFYIHGIRHSFSNSSANQHCVRACNAVCCPVKIHDVVSEMKDKLINLFKNDTDRFLEVELRCAITELFYINILISRCLLNLYPQVLEGEEDNREAILRSLGYLTETDAIMGYDKKLFSDLRGSFFVKRNKYRELCKKWQKATGGDFVIDDSTMMLFQMKIDLINMILFETLLYDYEPGYVKRLRND